MDVNTLVHSKGFDNELTYKLIETFKSSTWVEDIIDYIGEIYNAPEEDCDGDCEKIDELEEQKEEIQGKLNTVKSEINAKITVLREEMGIQGSHLDLDYAVDSLLDTMDEYVDFRLEKMENARKIIVGGIELPEKHN